MLVTTQHAIDYCGQLQGDFHLLAHEGGGVSKIIGGLSHFGTVFRGVVTY